MQGNDERSMELIHDGADVYSFTNDRFHYSQVVVPISVYASMSRLYRLPTKTKITLVFRAAQRHPEVGDLVGILSLRRFKTISKSPIKLFYVEAIGIIVYKEGLSRKIEIKKVNPKKEKKSTLKEGEITEVKRERVVNAMIQEGIENLKEEEWQEPARKKQKKEHKQTPTGGEEIKIKVPENKKRLQKASHKKKAEPQ